MKKMFVAVACILMSVLANAQFNKAALQASGLTCAMCTKAIHTSLMQLSFVEKVDADIKNSQFNITFKAGQAVDIDALQKAVVDAGFSVAKLKLQGEFDKVAIGNDAHVNIAGKQFHFVAPKKNELSGQQEITVVDKDFLSAKDFKKYSAATKMACIKTGRMASCCSKDAVAGDRIYHVTI